MNSPIRITLFVLCLVVVITGCQSQQTSQSSQSTTQSSTESSSQSSSESSQENSNEASNEKSNESTSQSASSTSQSATSQASSASSSANAADAESTTGTPPPPPAGDGYPSSATANQSGEEIYSPAGANTTGGTPSGVTTEEAIGELDEQLNASLGVFDGMILTERAAAQSQQADTNHGSAGADSDDDELAGTAGDSGFGGPLFEEGDLSEAGGQSDGEQAGEDGEEATVAAMPGSTKGDATLAGRQTSGGDGTVPPDLVDGSDDDIVARQIREAAIKETDPALKEKLWQEYRNYKKGL